jgi:hypothetical protein
LLAPFLNQTDHTALYVHFSGAIPLNHFIMPDTGF